MIFTKRGWNTGAIAGKTRTKYAQIKYQNIDNISTAANILPAQNQSKAKNKSSKKKEQLT